MKYSFPQKVEFYITNVCNLTCDNCNRFNNHKFAGWQRWSDYEQVYQRWANYIDLNAIVLMGGEPTLNPTCVEWVLGLQKIFDVDVQVLTNGTRLHQVPNLYEAMLVDSPVRRKRNHIGISLHNMNEFETIRSNVREFLQGEIQEWGKILGVPAPSNYPDYNASYSAADKNGVLINAWVDNTFDTAAIQVDPDGRFTVPGNPDPQRRHDQCNFVIHKGYHFIKGKLYKCGPVALMPEFDEQHNLNLSPEDRALLNGYVPLSMDNIDSYGAEFFENLDKMIPQCKFCAHEPQAKTIWPLRKGSVKL